MFLKRLKKVFVCHPKSEAKGLKENDYVTDHTDTLQVGVFSDSRQHEYALRSEIQNQSATLGYFEHPRSIAKSGVDQLDETSAWVVLLSEGNNDEFLEIFVERCFHRPTLFLSAKDMGEQALSKISTFITETKVNRYDVAGAIMLSPESARLGG